MPPCDNDCLTDVAKQPRVDNSNTMPLLGREQVWLQAAACVWACVNHAHPQSIKLGLLCCSLCLKVLLKLSGPDQTCRLTTSDNMTHRLSALQRTGGSAAFQLLRGGIAWGPSQPFRAGRTNRCRPWQQSAQRGGCHSEAQLADEQLEQCSGATHPAGLTTSLQPWAGPRGQVPHLHAARQPSCAPAEMRAGAGAGCACGSLVQRQLHRGPCFASCIMCAGAWMVGLGIPEAGLPPQECAHWGLSRQTLGDTLTGMQAHAECLLLPWWHPAERGRCKLCLPGWGDVYFRSPVLLPGHGSSIPIASPALPAEHTVSRDDEGAGLLDSLDSSSWTVWTCSLLTAGCSGHAFFPVAGSSSTTGGQPTAQEARHLGHLGGLYRSAALTSEVRGPWQHSYGAVTCRRPDHRCLPPVREPVQACQKSTAVPLGGCFACGKQL